MTPVKVDRIGRSASENYRQMARDLNAQAAKQDREHRPLTARKTRFMARIARSLGIRRPYRGRPGGEGGSHPPM